MDTSDHISNDLTSRSYCCYPQLTKVHMNLVIKQCGGSVTHERSKKDQGNDGVVHVIIGFKLSNLSMMGTIMIGNSITHIWYESLSKTLV